MHSSQVAIVTDSTADIPENTKEQLKIEVVPAIVIMDGESYHDGLDISRSDFYKRLPNLASPASTGAPSPILFEKAYQKVFDRGAEEIVSIHLPAKLSSMIDVATQAAKKYGDRIQLFESGQLSLGTGFQVIEAAEAAQSGATMQDVLQVAKWARENVRLIALIDNLESLRRSGRINWVSAGVGNLLQVKLLVQITDGVVKRIGQVRTRAKAMQQLETIAKTWGPLSRLAIPHSSIPDVAQAYAEQLNTLSRIPAIIMDVTTAIGAHIGTGAIGIIGLLEKNQSDGFPRKT